MNNIFIMSLQDTAMLIASDQDIQIIASIIKEPISNCYYVVCNVALKDSFTPNADYLSTGAYRC